MTSLRLARLRRLLGVSGPLSHDLASMVWGGHFGER